MAFVTTLLNGVPMGASGSIEASECESSDDEGGRKIESSARDKITGTRGNLYNFIKVVAKIQDYDAALVKLADAIARSPNSVNVKNAKGSTPLHACGYLKRWDLARLLLAKGADPSQRNQAGHSFFLTAVRDAECPWESLFENFPELIERHQKFLAKSTHSTPQKSDKVLHRRTNETIDVRPYMENVGPHQHRERSEEIFLQFLAGKVEATALIDAGCLDEKFLKSLINDDSMTKFIELANLGVNLSSGVRCLLAERLMLSGGVMAFIGNEGLFSYLSSVMQKDFFYELLDAKNIEMIESLAKCGASYGEDFIETCEEHEFYELADFLIDWRDTHTSKRIAPEAVGKTALPRKKSQARSQGKPRNQKPKNRRTGGGGGRQKVAKIANLDGPQKEANEFEYRERIEPHKATVIIVKKARRIMTDDGDASGGNSIAV